MIGVRVHLLNGNRLAKLRRELDYIAAGDLYKRINLAEQREELLHVLKQHSPAKGQPSETRVWMHENGKRRLDPPFREGWFVRRHTTGNILRFEIGHELDSKGERGKRKFASIEYGSNPSAWRAKRTYRFKSRGKWYNVLIGSSIVHTGNEGAHAIEQTSDFIQNTMIPQVKQLVNEFVKSRFRRV